MKVRECMCTQISCVSPETNLNNVAKIMKEKHVGCIPVCNNNSEIVGLITDRDLVLRGIACNKDTNTTPASEIMTTKIYSVTPEETVDNATKTMCECQVRRIPVIENNTMIGILTLADIANHNEINEEHVGKTVEGICKCGNHARNNE